MSENVSPGELRAAVSAAISRRMSDARITIPDIMERSGLSENTVRDMIQGKKSHNDSSWIAASFALGFEPDYLLKILNGQVDANAPVESPVEQRIAQLTSELADISTLREDVDVLKDVVYRIDKKIDIIISGGGSSGTGAGSN